MDITFNATPRTDLGKGASRRLRRAGHVPAILYGQTAEPLALTLEHNGLFNALNNTANIFTSVINLQVNDKTHTVFIKDLQRHPSANRIVHVDFLAVTNDQVVHKSVPIVPINVEQCAGVKLGALLTLLQPSVEVRCLAKDLPHELTIDCSVLSENTNVKLSAIPLPANVALVPLLKGGKEYDHAVLSIGKVRK